MAKIVLVLPGDGFHSNVLAPGWEAMDASHVGLDYIGASGVPVSVSYQGIDFELMPWLRETIGKYPSIELLSASYSHTLLPLLGDKEKQTWEVANGVKGAPISFCAEFYAPKAEIIGTEAYLALAGMSYGYSNFDGRFGDVNVEKFPDVPVVLHGGKLAIMMRNTLFDGILKAFMRFQRDPFTVSADTNKKAPLENLLDEIEKVANMASDEVVVVPIDIEAPFVGSAFGADIWKMLFEGIVKRGLAGAFNHLTPLLPELREKAVKGPRPHRILHKWTVFEIQTSWLLELAGIRPVTGREKVLFSIASCSDILSALERKIGESQRAIVLKGKDPNGNDVALPISYNQDVIDAQRLALEAIKEAKSFKELLQGYHHQSLFVKRMTALAEKRGL